MIDLKLPDPEAVRELWATAWRYLTGPFRSIAPEGLAEFLLTALLLTLATLCSRIPYARRSILTTLLGLWVVLLLSLALALIQK